MEVEGVKEDPEGSSPGGWVRGPLGLALVLLVALGVRVLYLVEFQGAPDFEYPAVDAGFHDDWARTLIGDEEWERPAHRPDPHFESQPFFRPPGYPYLLGLVYRASGGCYLSPRLVNLAFGLLSVFLLHRLASRLLGPGAAFGAALLLALDPMAVYFEGELQAVTPFVTLLLASALATIRWQDEPGPLRAGLAGLLLALAALFRPNALALAAGTFLWMLLRKRPGRAQQALAFSAGVVLALLPSTVRNYRVSGELIPITTNLGINLFLGNHAGANGQVSGELPGIGTFETCYDYPALVARLEQIEGRELSPGDVSRWFGVRALEWIGNQPLAFLGLTARKTLLFWGPQDISHNKVVALEREHSRVLRWLPGRFALLLALAVGGAVALLGKTRRRRSLVLPLGWMFLYFASVVPFFVSARYRLPVEPFLALLGGVWLAQIVGAPRRNLVPGVTAAVVLLALVLAPPMVKPSVGKWHVGRAIAYAAAEDEERALAEYDRALEAAPDDARTLYLRSVVLAEAGRQQEALAGYERSVAIDPTYARAWNNLAMLRFQGGDAEGALTGFRKALELEPTYLLAWTNRAAAAWNVGRFDEALEACRAALALEPSHSSMRRMLAKGLVRRGDERQAIGVLEALAQEAPGDTVPLLELGWLRAAATDPDLRDAGKAREIAGRLESALGPRWDVLEVRAAAEALAGDPRQAAETAAAAIQGMGARVPAARRARLERGLEAYRAGRAFPAAP